MTPHPKTCHRRHREIQLQQVRQQEHPVGGRVALELGELHGGEFVDERVCPVGKQIS
jgi:hypothetical protein